MRLGSARLLLLLALFPLLSCDPIREVRRVVFITLDTTRADRLGCYGYADAETPNLDRLSGEGALFEEAVSAIPTTLPSHSTMFTGMYPFDHGVRYNIVFRLGAEAFTLAEALSAAGFATAAFPASYIIASQFGLDQGFDTWSEPPKSDLRHAGSPGTTLRPVGEGVDLAIDWLARQRGRKSFVWLHAYEPHAPYLPPFPYASRYRDRPYDGEIAYVDAQIGRLLDVLRDDPDWSDTLVIVVGDHGEGLHEHRERFHSHLVYETTQHVPLIIRAPGASTQRVAEPVSLVDLMPTVLDLTGVEPPAGLRGVSLGPALRGEIPPRRDIYFESEAGGLNYGWDKLHGIRRGPFKLIDSEDPELFDLRTDPDELDNLAGTDGQRLEDFRASLEDLTESARAGAGEAALPPVLDPETSALLSSLGYASGSAKGTSVDNAPQPRHLIDMDGEMMAAQGSVAQGNWPQVEELTRYILGRDPTNRWALQHSAQSLLALDRPREAQDQAAELLEHYPDAEQSYVTLARTYGAQQEHDTAFTVLESGLAKIPDSELLGYFLLVTAFSAGHDDVCAERLPEASSRHPKSTKIMVLQARCFARDGEIDSALLWLAKAVEHGFRQLELLAESDEFAAVVADRGFQDLLRISGELDDPGAGS